MYPAILNPSLSFDLTFNNSLLLKPAEDIRSNPSTPEVQGLGHGRVVF